MMRRIGYIVFVLLAGSLSVMAQGKTNDMKNEERLTEQIHYLHQLYQNADRVIKEYDDSNDLGKDVALWSPEKTIAEAKQVLSQILKDRVALHDEKSSFSLAYQSRVRRWSFSMEEKKSHYENALIVLSAFNRRYEDAFHEMVMSELDAALGHRYYSEAYLLLDQLLYILDSKASKELISSYIPKFQGSDEVLMLETKLLDVTYSEPLRTLEGQISYDQPLPEVEKEWLKMANELSTKVHKLTARVQQNNKYKAELNRWLQNLLDNGLVNLEVRSLNTLTGEVEMSLLAMIRSDAVTLYRSDENDRNNYKLKKYSGVQVLRTVVHDKLPNVGQYSYSVKNDDINRLDEREYITYNQIASNLYVHDQKSRRLQVISTYDGTPVAGVMVQKLDESFGETNTHFTTDKDGFVTLPLSPSRSGYRVKVNDPRLWNPDSYYIPGTVQEQPDVKDAIQLYYYLDRPIYRRGQEVKIGLLLVRSQKEKNHELADKSIDVKLKAYRGSKEELVQELTTITNKNGISEIKMTIPNDPELNRFSLESEHGTTNIRVEDYKLQYLNVKIDSIPKGYVSGQRMMVYGQTMDLNGNPTAANIVMTYDGSERIEAQSGNNGQFVMTTPPVSLEDENNIWRYGRNQTLEFRASDALGNVAMERLYFSKLDTDMPLSADALLEDENITKEHFTLDSSSQPYNSRLLGDLSGRTIQAELLSKENGENIALGVLPINGKKEFSFPHLKSGYYQLRLYATDGYGKEVSDTSSAYYFYSESDKTLNVDDDLLWVVKAENGTILYGSSVSTTLTMVKFDDEKVIEYQYIPVEKNVVYRFDGHKLRHVRRVIFNVVSGHRSDSESVIIDKHAGEANEPITLSGLDFTDDEYLLPSTHFKRTVKVKSGGRALKSAPVIVTVFDKAVADAAEDDSFWEKVGSDHMIPFGAYQEYASFDEVVLTSAPVSMRASVEKSAVGSGAPDMEEVTLRSNFAETAFFSALLTTDHKGQVVIEFDLPDTQTKYNIKVYTFDKGFKNQLISDHNFRVYSPLSIELSMPRFLTWDDHLEGEALLRNTGETAFESHYQVMLESGQVLAEGQAFIPAGGTKAVPFSLQADTSMGQEVVIQAKVVAGEMTDGVEYRLPLMTNLSTYIVAQPISLYKQDSVSLELPKVELGSSDAQLELYLDPIMVLLTQLAHDYRDHGLENNSFFGTVYQYNVYKRLEQYLQRYPDFRALLKLRAAQLSEIPKEELSGRDERLADPETLSTFFDFITSEKVLAQALLKMEEEILSHKVVSGGFIYSNYWHEPSPFLTSYILNKLSPIWKSIESDELRKHLGVSVAYLKDELQRQNSYYHDYIDYALIASSYGISLDNLSAKEEKEYHKQVEHARKNYQTAYTSWMLRFAEYSKRYDKPDQFKEVHQFIEDRSTYSYNDDELAVMKVFLAKSQEKVDEQLIQFLLKMKQATMWRSAGVMEVAEVILDKITPSKISDKAEVVINGQGYALSKEEKGRGFVQLTYPDLPSEMKISWRGVESDYVFGGVRYHVTEPSKSATPTGEKLKVRKQIFARKVSGDGSQEFREVTNEHPASKGDQLIIRYTIDTEQDLSLVTVHDPRPAGAEFGYDFSGYRFGDKLWFTYSRRDAEDRIYIDYLPRGQHTIELEATASNSGTFTYGPAEIQSTYAPEFAGNSAGGSITVTTAE